MHVLHGQGYTDCTRCCSPAVLAGLKGFFVVHIFGAWVMVNHCVHKGYGVVHFKDFKDRLTAQAVASQLCLLA